MSTDLAALRVHLTERIKEWRQAAEERRAEKKHTAASCAEDTLIELDQVLRLVDGIELKQACSLLDELKKRGHNE